MKTPPPELTERLIAVSDQLDGTEFDVTIDDATATDLPFAKPDVHRIQTLVFCPNTSNCTMIEDSI